MKVGAPHSFPPGLTSSQAAMMPAKVEFQDFKLSIEQLLQSSTNTPLPEPSSQHASGEAGEWFNAVLRLAPYLNPEGIHHALRILDSAMMNAQQAKALDDVIMKTKPTPKVQYAAERARLEVHKQQEQLLTELRQLRFEYGIGNEHGANAVGVAPGVAPGGGNLESNALVEAVHAALTGSLDTGNGLAAAAPPAMKPPILPTPHGNRLIAGLAQAFPPAPKVSAPPVPQMAPLAQAAQMLQAQAAQAMQAAQLAQAALVAQATQAANAQAQAQTQATHGIPGAVAAKLALSGALWPQHGATEAQEAPAPARSAMQIPAQQQQQATAIDRAKAPRQVQTLSMSLQLLSKEDPNRVFIVRRINKLGFKASRSLKRHFSQYGKVTRVLVAHSTVRQQGDLQSQVRRRPSSLGFVQMALVEVAQNILAIGGEQEIEGCRISVQRFEKQHAEVEDQESAELGDTVPEASISSTHASSSDLVQEGSALAAGKMRGSNFNSMSSSSLAQTCTGSSNNSVGSSSEFRRLASTDSSEDAGILSP